MAIFIASWFLIAGGISCVQAYLEITDSSLQNSLFQSALQKLESEEASKSKFMKESILDVTRLLIPYQDSSALKVLFDQHISKVSNTAHFKEEKKYYRYVSGGEGVWCS